MLIKVKAMLAAKKKEILLYRKIFKANFHFA